MAPKSKKEAVKETKVERKDAAAPAPAGKAAKASKKASAAPAGEIPAPQVDQEELEEQEDAAAASGNQGGSAAAALAATSTTEMSASFKNFRHHPDMENFYRFIYDNDLRHEALEIIDKIQVEKLTLKAVKGAKAQAH
jgi:hypothetical protein